MSKTFNITADGVILQVLTGSRAYGLETPESDYDFHGVYVTPTSELMTIGPNSHSPKSRTWNESEEQDSVSWEVGHFLFLATKCNPTVLETFVGPVQFETEYGRRLRELFPLVLTRQRVYDAFLGYSHNQQKKMFGKPDNPAEAQPSERAWKFAVQYLRVLIQGAHLLRTGQFELDMRKLKLGHKSLDKFEARQFLMDVKRGQFTMGYIIDAADAYKRKLELAFTESSMREAPDFDAVNMFLLDLRREVW